MRHRSWLGRSLERGLPILGLLVTLGSLGVLVLLLIDLAADGIGRLSWGFLIRMPSGDPDTAGVAAAMAGSLAVIGLTALIAIPLGVGAAVYLEEYAGRGRWARCIEVNIASLAGVPSIIYGLLGLALFVRALALGRSVLAGAATLALLVLPVVVLSTREAIRAVPGTLREASYALGATRWQTVWHQVLPAALPGTMTGIILACSRALAETAPLVVIGALAYAPIEPDGLLSPFTALPVQIFDWIARSPIGFRDNAAAGIIVLLGLLVCMNGVAAWLRDRAQAVSSR